jgi:hypothetical protein
VQGDHGTSPREHGAAHTLADEVVGDMRPSEEMRDDYGCDTQDSHHVEAGADVELLTREGKLGS